MKKNNTVIIIVIIAFIYFASQGGFQFAAVSETFEWRGIEGLASYTGNTDTGGCGGEEGAVAGMNTDNNLRIFAEASSGNCGMGNSAGASTIFNLGDYEILETVYLELSGSATASDYASAASHVFLRQTNGSHEKNLIDLSKVCPEHSGCSGTIPSGILIQFTGEFVTVAGTTAKIEYPEEDLLLIFSAGAQVTANSRSASAEVLLTEMDITRTITDAWQLADTNNDNQIDWTEINAAISDWISGSYQWEGINNIIGKWLG